MTTSGGTVTPCADLTARATIAFAAVSNHSLVRRMRTCQVVGCLSLLLANTLMAEQVRVMQWNVKSALGNIAQNNSAAAKAIGRIVNFNQPDILLFCEVTNAVSSGGGVAANTAALINWVTNNVPYLGSQPGQTFFVAVSSMTDGYIRNGAISRFPIANETTYNDGLRGLHAFTVQLAPTNLQVFHAHLKASGGSAGSSNCTRKQSEAQFDSNIIRTFAATNSWPYIFGGDWNEDEGDGNSECPLDSTYHPITTIKTNGGLTDFLPTTLSGNHLTWSTATTPSIRFDYLLAATSRLSPVSGFVFSTMDWAAHGLYTNVSTQNMVNDSKTASDHFCVFADYAFSALTPFQGWQTFYFGSVTNAAAAPEADPDHDGMSNWAEFLAGTDPTTSASVFRITSIGQEGNDLRVTWTMGSGKTNVLQEADSVGGTNGFTDVFAVLTVGTVTNYVAVGGATNQSARYYRVRLGP